jgi:soluble lytic murein transglycosylase
MRRFARRIPLESAGPWALTLAMIVVVGGCRVERGCRSPAHGDEAASDGKLSADRAAAAGRASEALVLRVESPFVGEHWFSDPQLRDLLASQVENVESSLITHIRRMEKRSDLSSKDRAGIDIILGLAARDHGATSECAARLKRAWSHPEVEPLADDLRLIVAQIHVDNRQWKSASELLLERRGGPRHALLLAKVQMEMSQPQEARATLLQWDEAELSNALAREFRSAIARISESAPLVELPSAAAAPSDPVDRTPMLAETGHAPAEKRSDAVETSANEAQRTALEKAQSLLNAREYASAARAIDSLLRRYKRASDSIRCEALYLKGTAIFKQRRRADSQRAFADAGQACKKSGQVDLEVKSRYQAARGTYAQGRYEQAGHEFEALARDHRSHSYADDALINGADAWECHGDIERARMIYESILREFPDGDMGEDARRHLLVLDFSQGNLELARTHLESFLRSPLDGDERAKLIYYRGRVHARMGEPEKAREKWLEVLDLRPLSYAGLLALSRLREAGALEVALKRMEQSRAKSEAQVQLNVPEDRDGRRAWTWALLGQGDRARQALEEADIGGWTAALVLARSGQWFASQSKIAKIGNDWRAMPPIGKQRQAWELAHPLVFANDVKKSEEEFHPPELLTFAIMQTESRFDPAQVSWVGARGLLQLMPGTAEASAKGLGMHVNKNDVNRPEVNLRLGVSYLAKLVQRFGNVSGAAALAVPSYNAGPGNVDKWLAERGDWDLDLFVDAIPFDETRNYTQSVLGRWLAYRWLYTAGPATRRVPYLPLNTPGAGQAARQAALAARGQNRGADDDAGAQAGQASAAE